MSAATGDTGLSVELYPDADNFDALQSLVHGSTEVRLPAGRWPIRKTLNTGLGFARVFRGYGAESTELVCTGGTGPVLGVASQGTWPEVVNYLPFDGFRLYGMTLTMTVDNAKNNNCLFVNNFCNDIEVSHSRAKGSPYEGFVIGGIIRNVWLHDIEAWDCGLGGAHFATATSGINPVSSDTILEDFVCLRCGQGVETGQQNVIVRRGTITAPGGGSPSLGVNIGSNNYGIYNTSISGVRVFGYANAFQIGQNGLGRLSRVSISGCETDGGISFAGGKATNNVTLDPPFTQGPDLYGSQIVDNIIRVNAPNNGTIIYGSGINLADSVYGREALTIARNTIYYDLENPALNTSPIIGFGGNVSGSCLVESNWIYGLDEAPQRGDVASFSVINNPTIPGMPNLAVRGNWAYNLAGRSRTFTILRG